MANSMMAELLRKYGGAGDETETSHNLAEERQESPSSVPQGAGTFQYQLAYRKYRSDGGELAYEDWIKAGAPPAVPQ